MIDTQTLLADPLNVTLPTTQADADALADALVAAFESDATAPTWVAVGEILGRLAAVGLLSDHIFDLGKSRWASHRPVGAMPTPTIIRNFRPALAARNLLTPRQD